jgi:hypothetical protein
MNEYTHAIMYTYVCMYVYHTNVAVFASGQVGASVSRDNHFLGWYICCINYLNDEVRVHVCSLSIYQCVPLLVWKHFLNVGLHVLGVS